MGNHLPPRGLKGILHCPGLGAKWAGAEPALGPTGSSRYFLPSRDRRMPRPTGPGVRPAGGPLLPVPPCLRGGTALVGACAVREAGGACACACLCAWMVRGTEGKLRVWPAALPMPLEGRREQLAEK